jgi:hypothetical protein
MNNLIYNPQISESFDSVRKFSFEQKKESLFDERKVNNILDTILEFKLIFSTKTGKINILVKEIERITWFNNLDNSSLILINDLISALRDLHTSLLRQYISLKFIRSKGIAKTEIKSFKNAIDDIKEVANDLESTFFFLPIFPDFKDTTKELSLI